MQKVGDNIYDGNHIRVSLWLYELDSSKYRAAKSTLSYVDKIQCYVWVIMSGERLMNTAYSFYIQISLVVYVFLTIHVFILHIFSPLKFVRRSLFTAKGELINRKRILELKVWNVFY